MWITRSRQWLSSFVLLAATGVGPAVGQEAVAQEADGRAAVSVGLAGEWSLNRALSDNPDDQLRNVRGGAQPPGGRPPGAGGRPSDGSSLDGIRRAAEGFAISQTDSTVTIAYPDRDLTLFTDGRKQKVRVSDDLEVEYRAAWSQGRLTVVRKLDRGITMTEEYSTHSGTGRLHVLTRLEGDPLPMTIAFMRVYDPAPANPEG